VFELFDTLIRSSPYRYRFPALSLRITGIPAALPQANVVVVAPIVRLVRNHQEGRLAGSRNGPRL
jgi:hypothetical protein